MTPQNPLPVIPSGPPSRPLPPSIEEPPVVTRPELPPPFPELPRPPIGPLPPPLPELPEIHPLPETPIEILPEIPEVEPSYPTFSFPSEENPIVTMSVKVNSLVFDAPITKPASNILHLEEKKVPNFEVFMEVGQKRKYT